MLSTAVIQLNQCLNFCKRVSRVRSKFAHCLIKKNGAKRSCQSIIAASLFQINLSLATASTLTSITVTFLSLALWISKNISHPNSMDDRDSYAGRWLAKVRGKIVAQGGTPEQALYAAQASRHKEKPEIIYMSFPFPFS